MYGYFYPETGERYLAGATFETVAEAVADWHERASHWQQIKAMRQGDKAAFMRPSNGDIVVVREVTPPAARDGERGGVDGTAT